MIYFKCLFCNELFLINQSCDKLRHDDYPHGCQNGLLYDDDTTIVRCYSCCTETNPVLFTKTQIRKGAEMRCMTCVENNIVRRYPIFPNLPEQNINYQLLLSVANIDIDNVKKLLEVGADPNYNGQKQELDIILFYVVLFMHNN